MNSASSHHHNLALLLAPRDREEEEAQLQAAITASIQDSLHEDEERDEKETELAHSRNNKGRDEIREMMPTACRRRFVGEEFPFFDNFLYPQKRLQQAQGEFC